MISKFFYFLKENLQPFRTKGWEKIITYKSKDTLERSQTFKQSKDSRVSRLVKQKRFWPQPMLLPSYSILIWKDPEDTKGKKRGARCLSILFDIGYNGKNHQIAMKRPLNESVEDTISKMKSKIEKSLNVDNSNPQNDVPANKVSVNIEIPSHFPGQTIESVFDTFSYIRVNGVQYSILLEPTDVSIVCQLRPLVNHPLYPVINYRQGSSTVNIPITLHWFVYSPAIVDKPSKQLKGTELASVQEEITLVNESTREFSITNCEYRATADHFVPMESDVGKKVMVLADNGRNGIVRCGVSKYPIECIDEPPICGNVLNWCQRDVPDECFRLISYNILADLYLDLSGSQDKLFFPYCPKEYQSYEYRYPMILKELKGYNADIFFLQEVDERMQMRYLSSLFKSMNVEMCFKKKEKNVNEGTVIAFKKDRFELLSSTGFGLSALLNDHENEDIRRILNSSDLSRQIFISRPTILQVVILKDILTHNVIICGNTHLHHNPEHEHLKVFQAVVARRKLESVRMSLGLSSKVRILFAGDFNSTVDGPVYDILSKGSLSSSNDCWELDKTISSEDIKLLPSGGTFINLTGSPIYTNYTRYTNKDGTQCGFSGCLDYIWAEGFKVLSRAPLPDHDLITKYGALPSKIAPSDHVPIMCEVTFDR